MAPRRRRPFGEIYRAERAAIDRDPWSRRLGRFRAVQPVGMACAVAAGAFAVGGWGPAVGVAFLALAALMTWLVLTDRW